MQKNDTRRTATTEQAPARRRRGTNTPAGMPPARWGQYHRAMEARLFHLLESHTFPGYKFKGETAVKDALTGASGRNRVRTLAVLVACAACVKRGAMTPEGLLLAMTRPEPWGTTPDTALLERRKRTLVRFVVYGCERRGEVPAK